MEGCGFFSGQNFSVIPDKYQMAGIFNVLGIEVLVRGYIISTQMNPSPQIIVEESKAKLESVVKLGIYPTGTINVNDKRIEKKM